MRVLIAHCFYRSSAPSGEDSVVNREIALLRSHGVDVVTYEKHNDNIQTSSVIKKISAAQNCIWSTKAKHELKTILSKYRPDIVHFHNTFPQMSLSVYSACKEAKIPIVQTLHNFRFMCSNALFMRDAKPCEKCIDNGKINVAPALKYKCYRNSILATAPLASQIKLNGLLRIYSNCVDQYICLTGFSKKKFTKAGFPEEKISIKPNFVQDPAISKRNHKYAIYVGRLTSEKGVNTLISAWRNLSDIPLKIVGDGNLKEQLEYVSKDLGLNVEFLGIQNHVRVIDLISKAAFQIVPSECYEGFPAVVVEAFACGTPVIASRLGGLAEIVADGRTGYLFEAGNADDLVKKVRKFVKESENSVYMSTSARNEYKVFYTPEVNIEKLKNIYTRAQQNFSSNQKSF